MVRTFALLLPLVLAALFARPAVAQQAGASAPSPLDAADGVGEGDPAAPDEARPPEVEPAEDKEPPSAGEPEGGDVDEGAGPDPARGHDGPPGRLDPAPATDEAEPPAAPASDVTDAEMAELLKALGQDAEATAEDDAIDAAPTAAPSPDPGPAGAAAGAMGRLLQSMNPQMSFILDVAGAWFSPGWSIRGPGGEGFENYQSGAHDPSRTGFNLQQLELHVQSAVDPFFTLQGNIVFAQFGVEVEEAYATTTSLPWGFQARLGQFLTRFGRINPTHPHSWSFADQPLVNGKLFGGEGSRGLGFEVSWLAPLPWYLEVLGSVTDAAGGCCARSFFGGEDLGVVGPLDLLYTAGLRQFFPFGDSLSLQWGLSGQAGPNPTGKGNRTEIVGTDLYLRWRPVDSPGRTSVSWTTEAMVRRYQIPGNVLMDAGLYSQLVWQFWLQYELGARVDAVTGSFGDPLDPGWTGLRTRYAAEVTWYPSHFSRVRGQVAYGASGAGDLPLYEQLYDRPVVSVFFAFEFLIGSHGSHDF